VDVDVGDVDAWVLVDRQRLLKPRPLPARVRRQRRSRPASRSTRNTLDGLTATTPASIIM
jgi:hypothetical protein